MRKDTNKEKCKSTVDTKTRKPGNKITLLAICLHLMTAVSLILHIGILIGLASSIGALVGFALSFMSLSSIIGGVISSVSMLSAFYIIDKIRSNCSNHYVELVMAPNVNSLIKGSPTDPTPRVSSVEIYVYFGIGVGLVALDVKSSAAIGALTGAIISAIYASVLYIGQVVEYFGSRKPDGRVDNVTLKWIDDSLQPN